MYEQKMSRNNEIDEKIASNEPRNITVLIFDAVKDYEQFI